MRKKVFTSDRRKPWGMPADDCLQSCSSGYSPARQLFAVATDFIRRGCIMICILLFSSAIIHAEKKYQLISISPSITEEIFLLGCGKQLVGVTTFCKHPPEALKITKIGNIIELNIEKIVSLKPDIVIGQNINSQARIDKLKELGVKVIIIDEGDDFNGICSNFIKLGKLIDRKADAVRIVKECNLQLAKNSMGIMKPKILFVVGTNPLVAAGRNSFINDIIGRSGGKNIVEEDNAYLRYSIESAVEQNPDFIIIASSESSAESEKATWQRYGNLSAVKHNRIFVVDPDLFCAPVPTRFTRSVIELKKILESGNEK